MKNIDRQIKRIAQYEANARGILLAYEAAFDEVHDFQKFVEITAATIEAAMGIIRDIEHRYELMPEHMKENFARQQQEEWYNAAIHNPIYYSMDNTELETICDTIFSWLTDDERLLIARRGIVNRIVMHNLSNLATVTQPVGDGSMKSQKSYSEGLVSLFHGHTELIEQLICLSDDEIAGLITEWAKQKDNLGKPLIENPKNNLRSAFAQALKRDGIIKGSADRFRRIL